MNWNGLKLLDNPERIKEIIDRECFEDWHNRRCKFYSAHLVFNATPCWICDRNFNLVHKLLDCEVIISSSKIASNLGRLGGLKGGKARADKLTPEQRKEIAKKLLIVAGIIK